MPNAIPASQIVNVLPGVISAGGSGLDLDGLALTNNPRVPIGTVESFASAAAVGAFFGLSSDEYAAAQIYFLGFTIANITPAALLFVQYPASAVPAYLRGGSLAGMTLAQLQALSGLLTLTIDGQTFTSSTINLSGVSSFSAAATAIQSALGAFDAVVTGAIAPATAAITASIAATVMTVTAIASGTPVPGAVLTGGGVTAGTTIVQQLTGPAGGAGTYQVSASQTVASGSLTATSTQGIMTVSGVTSGTLAVGQSVAGGTTSAGTVVSGLLTGTGGTGTYTVNQTQTVTSGTLNCGQALVAFDSVSNAFIITGGTPGVAGNITYATNTLSAGLKLQSTSGGVLSQGGAAATPGTFMPSVVASTQNFASFSTIFEPSISDKVAFAQWNNAQNNRYAYAMWDTNAVPTTNEDSSSAGFLIQQAGYSGTAPIYSPGGYRLGFFNMAIGAALDFAAVNGRTTYAFLAQAGLPADVTDQTIAENLIANGYNYYGAYATANQGFVFYYPGSITGEFLWQDSYMNEIWLNNGLQLALMELLTNIKAIPYNARGDGLIASACADPIQAALNYGAISGGVTLSALQIAEVNNAAGFNIATTLQNRGWYLLIQPATALVRAARASPPITLFYVDGGAVQRLQLSSLAVQ